MHFLQISKEGGIVRNGNLLVLGKYCKLTQDNTRSIMKKRQRKRTALDKLTRDCQPTIILSNLFKDELAPEGGIGEDRDPFPTRERTCAF